MLAAQRPSNAPAFSAHQATSTNQTSKPTFPQRTGLLPTPSSPKAKQCVPLTPATTKALPAPVGLPPQVPTYPPRPQPKVSKVPPQTQSTMPTPVVLQTSTALSPNKVPRIEGGPKSPPAPVTTPSPVMASFQTTTSSSSTQPVGDPRVVISKKGFSFTAEELKEKINGSTGTEKNQKRLEQILDFFCALGDIHPTQRFAKEEVNVVEARTWLLEIADTLLKNGAYPTICKRALEHFTEICYQDPKTKSSADQLYTQAEKMMNMLTEANKQNPRIQKKASSSCQALMELITAHYAYPDHLGAMPKELKDSLKLAADRIADTNKDKKSKKGETYTNSILEAEESYNRDTILRVQSDKRVLLDAFVRLIHLASAAGHAYNTDPQVFQDIYNAFQGIDFTDSRCDAITALRLVARGACNNFAGVQTLISMISAKAGKAHWRFLLFGLKELGHIAVNGSTHDIRVAAYNAMNRYSTFNGFSDKSMKLDSDKGVRIVERNPAIREQVLRSLFKIQRYSTDRLHVLEARKFIMAYYQDRTAETNPFNLARIERKLPPMAERANWLAGTGVYNPANNRPKIQPLVGAASKPAPAAPVVAYQPVAAVAAPKLAGVSPVLALLAQCLGITPAEMARLAPQHGINGEIRLAGANNLVMTDAKAMTALANLIKANKQITALDFSAFNTPGSKFNESLGILAAALPFSGVTNIMIGGKLSEDEEMARRVADSLISAIKNKQTISIHCDIAVTYANLAGASLRLGKVMSEHAIEFSGKALSLNPDPHVKSRIHYVKAYAYFEKGYFEQASAEIKKALNIDTQFQNALKLERLIAEKLRKN